MFFLRIFTGLITVFVAYAVLNYSGFCWAEKRYLTDAEKIRLAAGAVIGSGRPNFNHINDYMREQPGGDSGREYELEYKDYFDEKIWRRNDDGSYTRIGRVNVDEFLRQNPNCCKVVGITNKSIFPYSLWYRLWGDYRAAVEIKYTARFLDKQGNIVEFKNYKEYPVVKNCGYVSRTF